MTAAAAADGQSASESKPAEPKPAEPKPAEQKPAEPKPAEPKPAALTEQKPAEPPAEAKPAEPASKVPDKYVLTLPDGGRIDAHDLATIEALAREQGWSNDEAQQRVIVHADAIEAQSARFQADTKADPVYGGQHLDETLKHVGLALDTLRPAGTPRGDGFRGLLNKSGYGNNLEVVSFLADLGKLMAEDGTAGGGGASVESMDIATALYGPDKPAS